MQDFRHREETKSSFRSGEEKLETLEHSCPIGHLGRRRVVEAIMQQHDAAASRLRGECRGDFVRGVGHPVFGVCVPSDRLQAKRTRIAVTSKALKIGRTSLRERGCQYV